jgi:arabinofuranan 3-O-arabinosyltransferase
LYDLTLLGVSAAFLLRCAVATGFLPGEIAGLALTTALLLIMPFLGVPVGLFAAIILVLLIVRRIALQRTIPGSSYLQLLPQ